MADLNFSQGADPVSVYNDQSGNQMVVNADGSTNAQLQAERWAFDGQLFSLSGSFTAASGGNDNPIFLIKNPNASGKIFRIVRLTCGVSVTNVLVNYKVTYAPTITTNGTSQTPRNLRIGSATASVAQAFSLPTLSNIGTTVVDFTNGQNAAGSEILGGLNIILEANQNLVVTAAPASNNRAVQITVVWAEV